ncbi:ribosome-binding GTPase Rbg [Candidatus Mancarchaeum acidiphilum]|uniref:Ribosome-binding GTPase Rbg n=1 Tax=Candidatus Mancarchaeum acidiphilum TaxID=1920749 RepID=A0A218NLL4_9ARCH|nr:GTPase [Candidatus Mancarchaeum acidiphilum]ASI13367.1 ribosome-binding GTPase Rbg [Candidatus Mancarchaeum acidiphilum]
METKDKLEEKLEELKDEYAKVKDNKATNKYVGKLRAKIASIKKDIVIASRRRHEKGFFVKKTGDATIVLMGFPSTGKSSLLNDLTKSNSKTAEYAFTTIGIVPGTLNYRDAHLQILDMPGIINDAHLGAGNGLSVIAQMHVADLVAFVVDAQQPSQLKYLINELNALHIYIKEKPEIIIIENKSNGLSIINKSSLRLDHIKEIFNGFGIYNADVRIYSELSEDELIGYVSHSSTYLKAIVVLNKIDLVKDYEKVAKEIKSQYPMKVVTVSALNRIGMDNLKWELYSALDLIRIYIKPRMSDEKSPITLDKGSTAYDVAKMLHSEFADEIKYAYITGPSVKYPNQRVSIKHRLEDGDIVTFVKEK